MRAATRLEVDLFIGRNYVVTIHRGRVPALEEAFSRWSRGGALMREGASFVLYTVLDAIIDGYFPLELWRRYPKKQNSFARNFAEGCSRTSCADQIWGKSLGPCNGVESRWAPACRFN